MANWNRLFIRQGFIVQEIREGQFECGKETEVNMAFLMESLDDLFIDYIFDGWKLNINEPCVVERQWLQAVDFQYRGRGEGLWFRPGIDIPKIKELDTYISGVVRHLNRLGIHTLHCCDGHDKRYPRIGFTEGTDIENAVKVLYAAGAMNLRVKHCTTIEMRMPRLQLLDVAEKLASLPLEITEHNLEDMKKNHFLSELEKCLSIDGESENEEDIRIHVMDRLRPHIDNMTVDGKGNILAQKTYGNGRGPVILLNAHLDTVDGFDKERTIIKNGAIWSSSHGILGTDDRAGVAVVLELAKSITETKFNGKVKFVFTVEEEIGLKGASHVAEYFLWDVDAAFVLDRRGAGDIVTSYGGYEKFCDKTFGDLLEGIAENAGLEGWQCTAGGSSDTRIWASHGIQSVNLSIGYQNEHTSDEYLDIDACFGTVRFLTAVFQQQNDLRRRLRLLKSYNMY